MGISLHCGASIFSACMMQMDSQIPISGRVPHPHCMTVSVMERTDQVSTVSDISPLFEKTSHHSGHYSFTALKLSQSWIPCCPLRPVDGTKMAWPHTAEIFVFGLCRITIRLGHECERGDEWGTRRQWNALLLSEEAAFVNAMCSDRKAV